MNPSRRIRRLFGIPYPWTTALTWYRDYLHPSVHCRSPFDLLGPRSPLVANCTGQTASVVFLGDVMPIDSDLDLHFDPALRARISSADLVMINCEAPLGGQTRCRGTRYMAEGRRFGNIMSELGIRTERVLVSVANNHAEDHGAGGLLATAEFLEGIGCRVVGMRRGGGDEIAHPVDVAGLHIGVSSWTHWRNRPGSTSDARPWTSEDVAAADWARVRCDFGLDLLVGFPHWDLEFRHFPQPETRAFASRLVEGGFDLVVGHHPHVVQPMERIGDALVLYSCGNAVPNSFCAGSWPAGLGVLLDVTVCGGDGPAHLSAYRVEAFLFGRVGRRADIRVLGSSSRLLQRAQGRFDLLFPEA
jgi:poly-gamma-glutamate synthesis protein (capsule biosynthesis protein)